MASKAPTDVHIPIGPSRRDPEDTTPGVHAHYVHATNATTEELSREFDGDLKLLSTMRREERMYLIAHENHDPAVIREEVLECASASRSVVFTRLPGVDGLLECDTQTSTTVHDWIDALGERFDLVDKDGGELEF